MTGARLANWCLATTLGAVLSACGRGEPPKDQPVAAGAERVTTTYRDSLVFTAPGGEQVWFTDGRAARDDTGGTCHERVMEIRTPTDTIPVPLLYTGQAPTLQDDTTLRARVWLDCMARAQYRVSIATGRPSLVEP